MIDKTRFNETTEASTSIGTDDLFDNDPAVSIWLEAFAERGRVW